MKLLAYSAFAFVFAVGVTACGGETNSNENPAEDMTKAMAASFNTEQLSAQQQAWDKVMTIHDEVMPKMGTMNQMTKSLKAQWENNEQLDAATKDDISIAIQELESADEGMWDWMHELKQLKSLQESASSHDAVMKYLQEQEQSIILVREEMANSVTKADSLLKVLGE